MMVKRGLVSAEFSRKWCLIMAEALACGLLAVGSEQKYVQGFVAKLTRFAWSVPEIEST
jgi:hypothetical protein